MSLGQEFLLANHGEKCSKEKKKKKARCTPSDMGQNGDNNYKPPGFRENPMNSIGGMLVMPGRKSVIT